MRVRVYQLAFADGLIPKVRVMVPGVVAREGAAVVRLWPGDVGAVVGECEGDEARAVPVGADFERVLGTGAGLGVEAVSWELWGDLGGKVRKL